MKKKGDAWGILMVGFVLFLSFLQWTLYMCPLPVGSVDRSLLLLVWMTPSSQWHGQNLARVGECQMFVQRRRRHILHIVGEGWLHFCVQWWQVQWIGWFSRCVCRQGWYFSLPSQSKGSFRSTRVFLVQLGHILTLLSSKINFLQMWLLRSGHELWQWSIHVYSGSCQHSGLGEVLLVRMGGVDGWEWGW